MLVEMGRMGEWDFVGDGGDSERVVEEVGW